MFLKLRPGRLVIILIILIFVLILAYSPGSVDYGEIRFSWFFMRSFILPLDSLYTSKHPVYDTRAQTRPTTQKPKHGK
jgi:hypothetical protein